jgi:Calx-beta domain
VLTYDHHAVLIGADYAYESITDHFDGKLDEVDLFDRALTASEIQAIYAAGASGKSTQAGIAIADVDIAAAATSAVFQVSIAQPSASAMSVDYTTVNGTALSARDYTATSGTLSIPAHATSATITVPLLNASLTSERTFYMQLSNPVNAVLADDQAAAILRQHQHRHTALAIRPHRTGRHGLYPFHHA